MRSFYNILIQMIFLCIHLQQSLFVNSMFNGFIRNAFNRLPRRRYVMGFMALATSSGINKNTTSEFVASIREHSREYSSNTNGAQLPCQCPMPDDIQSDYVKKHFNHSKMEGTWYELAMKDLTQPRYCSCQTSTKSLIPDENGGHGIQDDFRITCAGQTYLSKLSFKLNNESGTMVGKWNGVPLVDKLNFPNTVVDVGLDKKGNYKWVIEYQCLNGQNPLTKKKNVSFYAFNFYCKDYKDAGNTLKIMERRARQRGLSPFIDHGAKLAVIDHSQCNHGCPNAKKTITV